MRHLTVRFYYNVYVFLSSSHVMFFSFFNLLFQYYLREYFTVPLPFLLRMPFANFFSDFACKILSEELRGEIGVR